MPEVVAYALVAVAAWLVMVRRWGPVVADECTWPMAAVLFLAAAVLWPLSLLVYGLGRLGERVAREP